ncbi:MAG: hypothetical protein SOT71_06160 [Romboutsia timonensis]|uniref:hypothetical protein n=1 Tax=Romboutsia timonensis TaxID=1776391 RepID=UPI002A74D1E7|nr:hypothetical protein [Romboutsia timonensis]MDY2882220.1 hypothetical protein [Romboutsia timonensis]
MANYSVKTFENDGLYSLELEISVWLDKNKDIKIINISHSTHTAGFSAIILYEKE